MTPNQAVEFLAIDQIAPYPRNPRTHPEANIAKLVASIKEFGWTTPILVDEDGAVLAGHGRLLAARALQMPQVPCLRIPGLSSAQKRAYRLADNRLTLDSDWDLEMLALELKELGEFDLTLTGFDPDELDDILGLNGPREGEDDTPAIQEIAISQPREIWALDEHRLLCGDCTDRNLITQLFSQNQPFLVVTDPPFGVGYNPKWREDNPRLWQGNVRVKYMERRGEPIAGDQVADWSAAIKISGATVAYLWHAAGKCAKSVFDGVVAIGFEIRGEIIWVKEHAPIAQGGYSYQHEACCYAALKGKPVGWKGAAYESTVINAKSVTSNSGEDFASDHACQKPVECMRRPIINHTISGDLVYDPFMGSGTTLIAAETTHRIAYGCEIEPLYVDMAIRRWQTFTGKTATRLQDGKAFEG